MKMLIFIVCFMEAVFAVPMHPFKYRPTTYGFTNTEKTADPGLHDSQLLTVPVSDTAPAQRSSAVREHLLPVSGASVGFIDTTPSADGLSLTNATQSPKTLLDKIFTVSDKEGITDAVNQRVLKNIGTVETLQKEEEDNVAEMQEIYQTAEEGSTETTDDVVGKSLEIKQKNSAEEQHFNENDTDYDNRNSEEQVTDQSKQDNIKTQRDEKTEASAVGSNPVQLAAADDSYDSSDHRNDKSKLHMTSNLCRNVHCKRGKVCEADEERRPKCVCQDPATCPPSTKEFDHVCGTDNKTYDTSCQLFATKCQLEGTKKGHQLHLDYIGACKYIAPCTDYELVQFPLRMREWLKNVLVQLYEHDLEPETSGFLSEKQKHKVKKIYEDEKRLRAGDHPLALLECDFQKNYHMYIYPVHWQFSQLDQHPADRYLTHSELAPLRAPLVPMEHCTSHFFEVCDTDKDKNVSLKEWCSCFDIKEEDIDENLLI